MGRRGQACCPCWRQKVKVHLKSYTVSNVVYSLITPRSATSKSDLATLESLVDIESKWKFGEKG
jgi:hypothetical protein